MMIAEKIYQVEPVGTVFISKNDRSRRIRLRVNPDGQVQVSMPTLGSEQRAIDFVKSKSSWIITQQNKIRSGLTVFSEESNFKTRFHKLKVVKVAHPKVSTLVGNGIIQINVPHHHDPKRDKIQQYIRRIITQVMRQEAKVYLPSRLKELAQAHSFRYENVVIKNAKSRWGSCSSANNINLNLNLMRLPAELIDYVLLHELAHTVEKNHGKGFWRLLEKVCPEAKKHNKTLKKYHVDIY